MKPQLVLLGAPGSGKGTQAASLVSNFEYKHLSSGDLLRNEIKSGSDLGNRVSEIVSKGNLVSDDIVLGLIDSNCELSQTSYIFDGFPRNIDQAKSLDDVVIKDNKMLALYFEIDLDILAQRLINRRTCGDCGEIYNLISKAPKVEEICDKCGTKNLQQRKDDNAEIVTNRLSVFKATITPVLEYYKQRGCLEIIDASDDGNTVFDNLKKAVEKREKG